jgi:hypothetical protein
LPADAGGQSTLCAEAKVVTTDSNHGRKLYRNLTSQNVAHGCRPALDGRYHLETKFAYLAVVTDAFSRRVIG